MFSLRFLLQGGFQPKDCQTECDETVWARSICSLYTTKSHSVKEKNLTTLQSQLRMQQFLIYAPSWNDAQVDHK